jgi:hypothetical protein
MPLLDLKTDLKSLKYGQDTPGGGDSGQPYIRTDINNVDSGFNKLRFTKFDDGLIRGGAVGAIGASVVDTLRISKFLTDLPKGPLFIAKQVGLQLSNPQLQHKKTLPTNRRKTRNTFSTKGQGFLRNSANAIANAATSIGPFITDVVNKIENVIGPTRIYNLGINTLAQVPVNAIGGHIMRHGFLPINDESKLYYNVVKDNNFLNNNNRLEEYANTFQLGGFGEKDKWEPGRELTSYIGGPGSVYGIGNTIIKKSYDAITNNWDNINRSLGFSKDFAGKARTAEYSTVPIIKDTFDYKLSNLTSSIYRKNETFDLSTSISPFYTIGAYSSVAEIGDKNNPYKPLTDDPTVGTDFGVSNFTSSSLASNSFSDLPTIKNSNSPLSNKIANQADKKNPFKYDVETKNSNDTVPLGPSSYPGTNANDLSNENGVVAQPALAFNYANPSLKKYSELKEQVKTNISQSYYDPSKLTPNKGIFKSEDVSVNRNSSTYTYNTGAKVAFNRTNDRVLDNDEIVVLFNPINPFSGKKERPLKFLSYITNYSENYDSDWGDVKYVGRAESFYIFKGFKKTISLGLHVPCFNSDELVENHDKLLTLGGKSLAYSLAGQYNEQSLLGGVIINLTVGRYLIDSPGIITSLKFDIVDGSSWDLDYAYAHMLKIDLGFTVIGNELPIYSSTNFALPPKPEEKDPIKLDKLNFKYIPPPSDYLGAGLGFETSQGNTDAQKAFRQKQLDKKFGIK